MAIHSKHIIQWALPTTACIVIGLLLLQFSGAFARTPDSPHRIYIAFGFHGNLYHSFRNDTNDEYGFGKDIRVIRHIIATMDRLNQEGVPVKAVWDFDNLFSLQEYLPRYAPDIIDGIRRRIHANGDEAILMSYNNGLVSAMTEQELKDAVRWSISNPWQSGVKDVFGAYAPIVRPQEMMTTPGSFAIYTQLGIKAMSLYYSATPFDAFRVFSRPLTHSEAYNPILYRHPQTKEEMVVIPSYHIGDLVEHVSLRHWVEELRLLQENGKMKHDALIFINFDADSDFWSGIDLPWLLEWLPNTDGIGALVREVKDLPYVRFTSLSDYLKHHDPVGTFHFSQDTADGSFNGYNSWAEKAQVGPQWTRIERSRRLNTAARKALALLNHPAELADLPNVMATAELIRLRALSTTHFGMATPYVAPQRQEAAEHLLARLDRYSDEIQRRLAVALRSHLRTIPPAPPPEKGLKWLDTFALLQCDETNISGSRFLHLEISSSEPATGPHVLAGPDGSLHHPITYGPRASDGNRHTLRLYVPGRSALSDGVYHLYQDLRRSKAKATSDQIHMDQWAIDNGVIELRWERSGKIEGIYLEGERMAEAGSLMPHVRHNDNVLSLEEMVNEIVRNTEIDPPVFI